MRRSNSFSAIPTWLGIHNTVMTIPRKSRWWRRTCSRCIKWFRGSTVRRPWLNFPGGRSSPTVGQTKLNNITYDLTYSPWGVVLLTPCKKNATLQVLFTIIGAKKCNTASFIHYYRGQKNATLQVLFTIIGGKKMQHCKFYSLLSGVNKCNTASFIHYYLG